MKKVLYSTTALAAAGMFAFSGADAVAAEKVKLGLGGYYVWAAGVSDSESDMHKTQGSINTHSDSEVYVRGNTTLDNGIRVDAIIQFETDQATTNQDAKAAIIDESYLKVGNLKQWGEFRLGTTKSAHFIFRAMGPHVSSIVNSTNGDISSLYVPSTTPLAGAGTFFNHEGGADRHLVMYVTPNLNGFQAGISHTPGYNNTNTPPQTKGADAAEASDISIGANYKGKFGDASVAVSGGYTKVDGKKGDGAEYTTLQGGLKVSFAGFSIGGHWAAREDDTPMSNADDREGYMAGIGYKTGPWNVALTWLNTTDDTDETARGEVEHNQYALAMTYSLGAGVSVGASVFSVDLQDEWTAHDDNETPNDPSDDTAAMPGTSNEGWGVLGGIRVNF